MNILFVSKEWEEINNTGLGITASTHLKILKDLNYNVSTVSLNENFTDHNLELKNFFSFIKHPIRTIKKAKFILDKTKPDLIIVEGLQTLISEIFLVLSIKKKVKTALFSHGISIFPYNKKIKYLLRYFAWLSYIPLLRYILSYVDIYYSLDLYNEFSRRHYDTQIRKKLNPINNVEYFNISRFEDQHIGDDKVNYKKKILVLGYLNHIKNQKEIIEISKKVSDLDLDFRLVYSNYNPKYKKNLEDLIKNNNIQNIQLINHNQTKIEQEIKGCWLMLNVSITEVMPLSLLEGMFYKKPFLSFKVGSIDKLEGGLVNHNIKQLIHNLKNLYFNKDLYDNLSNLGKEQITRKYNYENLKKLISKTIKL